MFEGDINFVLLLLKMIADILKFTDILIIDESIEVYKYHEYDPITGTNLNNGGDIRISIESQDVFTHPSESYLIFDGRLTKTDDTAYANANEVALTNNTIMHLFIRIEYHFSIESLNNPGQATTMLGLLKYPDDFSKAQGLNQLWYKDTATTAANADNNGFAARQSKLLFSRNSQRNRPYNSLHCQPLPSQWYITHLLKSSLISPLLKNLHLIKKTFLTTVPLLTFPYIKNHRKVSQYSN